MPATLAPEETVPVPAAAARPPLFRASADQGVIGFYNVAMTVIIIVDLACFTVAYGVEHPRLGNEVRSVEPTLFGWFIALICYPPINLLSFQLLGWFPVETPPYTHP